jgi:transcriptional antiterminator NusG
MNMIYALKVTLNQERNVARMLESKIRSRNITVQSILAPEVLKGYLFIEAKDKGPVEEAIEGLRHVRSILEGEIVFEEIEHFLEAKPSVTGIEKGDLIELIAGPFKGERAKVIRIDVDKEELTIELIEAIVPIPITVRGDYVRIVQKKG